MSGRPQPSLLASSALVSLLTIAISLLGFVNQLLIARLFGLSQAMTAYGIASSAPLVVANVLATGLVYSLVPLLVRTRMEDPEAHRFYGAILIRVLAGCVVMTLGGLAISTPLVNYLGRSLDPEALRAARAVGLVSWAALVPNVALSHLTAVHNAGNRFIFPVLAGACPYVGAIGFVVTMGQSLGILAIALGLLVGTSLGAVLLLIPTFRETRFGPTLPGHRTELRSFFRAFPAVSLSMLIFIAFPFCDAYWAPQVGVASLPALNIGQRLLVAFGGLVVSGPFAIIVPRLAQAVSEGRDTDFRDDCARALRTVLSFGTFVALAVSVVAGPLVALLFERGQFGPEATARVAAILPWMMAGMVPMLSVAMSFRAFYARGWVSPTVALSLGTIGGYFLLSGLLSRVFGTVGIAIAYCAVWWAALAFAVPALWREHAHEIVGSVNQKFIVGLLGSGGGTLLAMLVPARLLLETYATAGKTQVAFGLLLCGGVGLATFYVLAVRVFRMADTELVFGFFGGLLRRLARRPTAGTA